MRSRPGPACSVSTPSKPMPWGCTPRARRSLASAAKTPAATADRDLSSGDLFDMSVPLPGPRPRATAADQAGRRSGRARAFCARWRVERPGRPGRELRAPGRRPARRWSPGARSCVTAGAGMRAKHDVVRVGLAERQPADLRAARTQPVDRPLQGFSRLGADALIRFGAQLRRVVAACSERAVQFDAAQAMGARGAGGRVRSWPRPSRRLRRAARRPQGLRGQLRHPAGVLEW
jgi:hypothetical protein